MLPPSPALTAVKLSMSVAVIVVWTVVRPRTWQGRWWIDLAVVVLGSVGAGVVGSLILQALCHG